MNGSTEVILTVGVWKEKRKELDGVMCQSVVVLGGDANEEPQIYVLVS